MMLLLACPVESDAAEHVIGNIRELTRFRTFDFFLYSLREQLHYIYQQELTLLVILMYPSLIGVTLHVSCFNSISVTLNTLLL